MSFRLVLSARPVRRAVAAVGITVLLSGAAALLCAVPAGPVQPGTSVTANTPVNEEWNSTGSSCMHSAVCSRML
jgi:hypothetical protein